MNLPWTELVPTLSIHPESASTADVARLAAELMAANAKREAMRELVESTLALERLDLEAFFDAPEDQADFARWRAAIARAWKDQ